MNARTKQFWIFQAVFWLIAGTMLLISGATQMPVLQAVIRNAFLLIAGFLSSFFLAMVIDELRWMRMLRLRVTSYGLAYLVALFCVVVINAITYSLRGTDILAMSFGQWVSGAMNLGLIYAFWSELFIQQIYFVAEEKPDTAPAHIVVERKGRLAPIELADVECVTAAGDYVEIHAAGKTYLHRQTLHAMAEELGAAGFLRIHRSSLVNRRHVDSVAPLARGRYQVHLASGASVTSSRGYRDAVQAALLAAAN